MHTGWRAIAVDVWGLNLSATDGVGGVRVQAAAKHKQLAKQNESHFSLVGDAGDDQVGQRAT